MQTDNQLPQDLLADRVELINPVLERYLNIDGEQSSYVLLAVSPPNADGKSEVHIATNLNKEHALAALAIASEGLANAPAQPSEAANG